MSGLTTTVPESEAVSQIKSLLRRYGGADFQALSAVLCPLLIPIRTLDKTIQKLPGQKHYRASFTVEITNENRGIMVVGRTGKFVPGAFRTGGVWREIAKGRVVSVNESDRIAHGEIYTGGGTKRADLETALEQLDATALWEIDQFGAAAKVLSALVEHAFCIRAESEGFEVRRMPEDMAQHLGHYANYDFQLRRNGEIRKVEVKSIWGTDTRFARLIHSLTTRPKGDPADWTEQQVANYYPTSSCKFSTQDIFAVSLFLRTGSISDFAFARSVPRSVERPHGLPSAGDFPDHVNQNPLCTIGDGTWFSEISQVWNLP
jgi:hypothetical protein